MGGLGHAPHPPARAQRPQRHLLVRRRCRDCRLPERAQLQQLGLLQQQQRCWRLREEVPRGPGLHRLPLVWLRFLHRLGHHHWPRNSWRSQVKDSRVPPPMDIGARAREKRQERLTKRLFLDHDTHVYIGYDLGNWEWDTIEMKKNFRGRWNGFLVRGCEKSRNLLFCSFSTSTRCYALRFSDDDLQLGFGA